MDLGCEVAAEDEAGNTPWHSAAEGGNVDVVKRLLKSGASLEQRNGAGITALHVAARCGMLLRENLREKKEKGR